MCVCKRFNEIPFRIHSQSIQIEFTVDEFDKSLSFYCQIAATTVAVVTIDAAVAAADDVVFKSIHYHRISFNRSTFYA